MLLNIITLTFDLDVYSRTKFLNMAYIDGAPEFVTHDYFLQKYNRGVNTVQYQYKRDKVSNIHDRVSMQPRNSIECR